MPSVRTRFLSCFACLAVLPFLAGCAYVPDLAGTVPANLEAADYPALLPIESLLVSESTPQDPSEDIRATLQSRRDSLKTRADRLNVPVVDDETQSRMKAGVTP
jgi:hypothetical protein